MQLRLAILVSISPDGQAKAEVVKAEVSQAVGALGTTMAGVLADVVTTPAVSHQGTERVASDVNAARHLASQLKIDPTHVEHALQTRPPGRVHEVLRWVRDQTRKTQVRSPTALFMSLVIRD